MRWKLASVIMAMIGCVLAVGCVTTVHHEPVYVPAPPPAVVGAEGEPFYDELAPHGEWVSVPGPGWVWMPYRTPVGWQPYRLGHWVFTDYGWTWASDEPYGHVVYHYGRWYSDPSYGWVWVPGTDWGPAWVAWNEGGGYVGWAPLPWQVTWRAGVGLDWGGVNIQVALGPSCWHFVPTRYLVAPTLGMYYVSPSRNVTLIRTTQHVTNYIYVNNRIVDHGVRVDKVGRAVGHTIPRYRVRSADPHERGRGGGYVKGDDFIVERPAAVRGARSHGGPAPSGEARSNRPGRRGQAMEAPDGGAGENSPETVTGESRPAREKSESRPSRYSRPSRPAEYPPVASPASTPAVEPEPVEREAPPGRSRRGNPSAGDSAREPDPSERPGSGRPGMPRSGSASPSPAGPENPAGDGQRGGKAVTDPRNPGSDSARPATAASPNRGRPTSANPAASNPGPAKQPPAKAKGKGKPGAGKSEKAKSEPSKPDPSGKEKQDQEEKESSDGN